MALKYSLNLIFLKYISTSFKQRLYMRKNALDVTRGIYPTPPLPKRLTSLYVCKTMLGFFLADAVFQSEARKIILPKYGIRKFKAKNVELATLTTCMSTTERNRFVT